MRVALVGDEYPPVTGGAAVYARELALHLSRLGVEVVVFTREGAEGEGVEVRELRGFGLFHRSLSPRLFGELRRELRSGGFSVVHGTDMYSPLSLAAVRFARGAGLPSVVTCHSVHYSSGLWRAVHLPLTLLLRRADRVIAVSGASREFCCSLGVPGERVEVVPNGVDPSLFHRGVDGRGFRRRLGVGEGERLVATAIRLVKRKGPHLLLRAFSELAGEFPGLRLAVAGEGPEEGELTSSSSPPPWRPSGWRRWRPWRWGRPWSAPGRGESWSSGGTATTASCSSRGIPPPSGRPWPGSSPTGAWPGPCAGAG
jgi:glycosyltransferase involved in cell wall biosynthesis